jgi:hypothetical protein
MSITLSKDDRCAVDLLLEHSTSPNQGLNGCFTQAASSEVRERLVRVEQVLSTLRAYAVEEPPGDLVDKTIARCEGRATDHSGQNPPVDPLAAAS